VCSHLDCMWPCTQPSSCLSYTCVKPGQQCRQIATCQPSACEKRQHQVRWPPDTSLHAADGRLAAAVTLLPWMLLPLSHAVVRDLAL
jgi:hypothetical protein